MGKGRVTPLAFPGGAKVKVAKLGKQTATKKQLAALKKAENAGVVKGKAGKKLAVKLKKQTKKLAAKDRGGNVDL